MIESGLSKNINGDRAIDASRYILGTRERKEKKGKEKIKKN